MSAILALIGSPILGSVFGIFGSWLTKREDRKNKELDQKHELNMATLSHTQKIELVGVEAEAAVKVTDAEAFKAAVDSEKKLSGNRILDGFKTLIRPVITVYLLMVLSFIAYKINGIIGGMDVIPVEDLVGMYVELIATAEFLTTTSVLFWFGVRPNQRK